MIIEVANEQEMKDLGRKIGASLKGGEVIELVGDVGAGKTTFVRGVAQGLGIDEDVQSPSFTISRVYDARDELQLAHYDFYRLSDPGIMADELRDLVSDRTAITIIEWAGIVEGVLPVDHLSLHFESPSETTRRVTLPENLGVQL